VVQGRQNLFISSTCSKEKCSVNNIVSQNTFLHHKPENKENEMKFFIFLFHLNQLHEVQVFFEKLIVVQLVKQYLAFLRNPKFQCRVHKSPPLVHFLSQVNPIRFITFYFFMTHIIIIFSSLPTSPMWSLPIRSSD